MEHAHTLNRPFPWRLATLFACAVALAALGALMLTHRHAQTRPAPITGHVAKRPVTPTLRPRSRVSVLVLNGNGIGGAAGGEATRLLARGYRHAFPSNAPSLAYARSVVLFRPGWKWEAARLARDARIPASAPLDGRVAPRYAHVPLILILGGN